MKKHLIAAICIAALSSNKSFAQFTTPPTITPNTSVTATGGNVGIGTANPAAKLDVFGTTNQLRLSNSSTIYSDINSTTNGLVFLPSSNANKVAFGISAPASGNGFHSNMGRFLMTDPAAPWPRGIIFQPNQTAGGDMSAGASITSGITAANAGEGLSLAPCAYGYSGVKLGAYAFNSSSAGGGWKSVWETQNVNIAWGYPSLLLMKSGGNVGIGTGTTTPREKLELIGNARIGAEGAGDATVDPNTALTIYQNGTGKKALKFKTWDNSLPLISIENVNYVKSPFTVYGDGRTYIGLQAPATSGSHNDAMLAVDGKILAKSIYVSITTGVWADYVFNKNYKLMPLKEVEQFYRKNNHLPGIQSAKEVEENGLNIEEMNIKLLEKIEELTIYMVELEKEIENIKKNK